MLDGVSAGVFSSDPDTRARAFIERAIASVESGEHESAMADLQEAERIAQAEGITELIAAARINQGYASSVQGDRDAAIRFYRDAAEIARENDDADRLKIALANLSVELKATNEHKGAAATLGEYATLLGEDEAEARVHAYIERGLAHLEMGDEQSAAEDLDEADRIATEAESADLIYLTTMNQGYMYVRTEDLTTARMVFERAVKLARESGASGQLRDALVNLAQVNRNLGFNLDADTHFTELEEICRKTGDSAALADALYWHGMTLQALRRSQQALAKWREEESIRRQLGQEGYLADCLHAQADALRRRGAHDAADPLYVEAIGIYRRLGITHILPSAYFWHGRSLWVAGKTEESLTRANEAIEAATEEDDADILRRAHGLRAMAAADLGDIASATEALDTAESLCEQGETHSTMVWMLARRAYVFARDGRSPDEVVDQLRRAHQYGLEHEQLNASRSAVRKLASNINDRCGDAYLQPLESLVAELRAEIDALTSTDMPPWSGVPSAAEEPAPAEAAVEEIEASAPEPDGDSEDGEEADL
jgi:tetratricopeptide (TPR) repeat protein